MDITKNQAEAFGKIIKKGMSHYGGVPIALTQFPDVNEKNIIGCVVWRDPDGSFTTSDGDTNQEFYIKDDGTICVYANFKFIPVNLKAKSWKNFCNPVSVGSDSGQST